MDDNNAIITASMGGHITQVGDTYYWVGNDQQTEVNGNDIHLYSSKTLGSNSWKHEGKLVDFEAAGHNNCTLLRSPTSRKFVIVGKLGLQFWESDEVTGPYTLVNSLGKGDLGNHPNYKIGGMGTFQDGDEAYVITSRRNLGEENNNRYTGIYKLTPDFTDVVEEVLWLRNDNREAMWLFKKGSTYYMTGSHTAGWTPSACYYRTATSLTGPWSEELEIGMDPEPTNNLTRSHGSQHRYIMQVNGQWIYGGDRYPYHESTSYNTNLNNGLNILCPVVWQGDHLVVQWQQTWTIDAAVSPYDGWSNLHFIESDPEGNDDGDSSNNMLEFALGGNPQDPVDQGTRPVIEDLNGHLRYRFPRLKNAASGVSYRVQYSNKLENGSWRDLNSIETGTEALNEHYEWVVNDISMLPESSRLFMRLKVIQN